MNLDHHRLVFNKARGSIMAVSEARHLRQERLRVDANPPQPARRLSS